MVTKKDVIEALKNVIDPELGTDIYSIGMIEDIRIEGESVSIEIRPTSPFCPMIIPIAINARKAVKNLGVKDVRVTVKGHQMAERINEMVNKDQ